MSVKDVLKKLFSVDEARESFDEFGQPIIKKTINERLLEKHIERDRQKAIKKELARLEDKHWREMTSMEMPYHKAFRTKKIRRRRR